MAKVILNAKAPEAGLTYKDLRVGTYIVNDLGEVYAVVYNGHIPSQPILASVSKPGDTWTGSLPTLAAKFRVLKAGESFTVTI